MLRDTTKSIVLPSAQRVVISSPCILRPNASNEGQIVAIALDISRQKALQESLITAREAAESADRIKSMFVASMSHELRTPLNSIIGFLGVVLQGMSGELNFKQKDQLGRAYHSAKHLLSLISDVIDISKIEAGFLEIHIEKFEGPFEDPNLRLKGANITPYVFYRFSGAPEELGRTLEKFQRIAERQLVETLTVPDLRPAELLA